MARTTKTNSWMAAFAAISVIVAFLLGFPEFAYANGGEAGADIVSQVNQGSVDDSRLDCEEGFDSLTYAEEDASDEKGADAETLSVDNASISEGDAVAFEELDGSSSELEAEEDEQTETAKDVKEAPSSTPALTLARAAASKSELQAASVPPEEDYDPVVVVSTEGVNEIIRKKVVDGLDYLFLPSYANAEQLAISWSDRYLNQLVYTSTTRNGTYSNGLFDVTKCTADSNGALVAYVRASEKGSIRELHITQSGEVRTLYLKSDDPENEGRAYIEASKDHYASATGSMTLVTSEGEVVVQDAKLTQIRGRGNSTWELEKKAYQLKLAEKASLLDGTAGNKAKTWLLLANALDESQLHNYVALKTALAAGLAATPDCEFVDLYYDGEYRGLYLLTEKVQVAGGRVDIDEIKNEPIGSVAIEDLPIGIDDNSYGYEFHYVSDIVQSATSSIKGGYLLELDNATYFREKCYFKTSAGYFVLKSPEYATYEQMKYISEYVQAAIDVASTADGNAAKYFDLDSLAYYFLVNELAKNPDYMRYSSTFFYKDADSDVLHAGPVWDFDLAFGVHVPEETGEYVGTSGITDPSAAFFIGNKQFVAAFKRALDSGFLSAAKQWTEAGPSSLRTIAISLLYASSADYFIWGNAPELAVVVTFDTRGESVDYLIDWLSQRIAWMESDLVASLEPSSTSPTVEPDLPATVKSFSGDVLTVPSNADVVGAPADTALRLQIGDQIRAQLAKLRFAIIAACGNGASIAKTIIKIAYGGAEVAANTVGKAVCEAAGITRIDWCWIGVFSRFLR